MALLGDIILAPRLFNEPLIIARNSKANGLACGKVYRLAFAFSCVVATFADELLGRVVIAALEYCRPPSVARAAPLEDALSNCWDRFIITDGQRD